MATPKSVFSRKRDLVYLIFFIIHVPIVLCTTTLQLFHHRLQKHVELTHIYS
jgi:hypothetical protein